MSRRATVTRCWRGCCCSGWLCSAGLVWLVLRHDADALWLPSPAGDGGVLVPSADLERPATSAVGRSHPDVVRAEVEFFKRGAELRGQAIVWARPLANPDAVRDASDAAVGARSRGSPAATSRGSTCASRSSRSRSWRGTCRDSVRAHRRRRRRHRVPAARRRGARAPGRAGRGFGCHLARLRLVGRSDRRLVHGDHRRRGDRGALLTVVLIVFAYRQVSPASAPEIIEFAVEDGTARLSVPALRKALAPPLRDHAPRLTGQRDRRQQG